MSMGGDKWPAAEAERTLCYHPAAKPVAPSTEEYARELRRREGVGRFLSIGAGDAGDEDHRGDEAGRDVGVYAAEGAAVYGAGEEGLGERSDVLLCGVPDVAAERCVAEPAGPGGCGGLQRVVGGGSITKSRLTTKLSDAGGPRCPNSQRTWPARIRSSDFVSTD